MNVPVTKFTLARLIVLTVGSFVAAFLLPAQRFAVGAGAETAIAVLFGVTTAFLIQIAAERRRELFSTVFIELNKLRRIYHISKNLAGTAPRFRTWFTDLHGHIYAYLSAFSGRDLTQYKQTNAAFRKVSYHIYTIPELETSKEEALFNDLLTTTGIVAESRQRIKELLISRLSPYSWVVVLLMLVGFLISVAVAFADTSAGRLVAGVEAGVALLAVDLLWELDTMGSDLKSWAKRYVDNVGKLELGRKDDV